MCYRQMRLPNGCTKEQILLMVSNLHVADKLYFNMFQEGGASITRMTDTLYCLYEIPLYGGKESFHLSGEYDDLEMMVDEALSWT